MIRKLIDLLGFLMRYERRIYFLFLPLVLSFLTSLFEGFSSALLLPLFKGMFSRDFSFIGKVPALRKALDHLPFLKTSDFSLFLFLIFLIFAALVLRHVTSYLAALSNQSQIRRLSQKIRLAALRRVFGFGKLFFDRSNPGYLAGVLNNYVNETVRQIEIYRNMLLWLFTNLVYLALLLYISWKLVFVVFLLFPAIHSSSAWLVGRIKKTAVFHTHLRKRVSQLIHGILCNMPLIWVSNQEEPEARRYSRLSLQMIDWEFSMTKKTLLIGPVQDIVNQVGLMLFVCIITFITLKPGHGADLSKYLVFFIVLRKMSGQFGQWNGFMASFARIEPVANEMREVIFSDRDKYYVTSGERDFPGLDQGIEFRGLRFSYVPGISILQDITLSIPRGRVTALVGPTGAGKTTLINLLLRFYECPESSIFIDGRDIREFSIKSLRSRMGLVSQETWLFDDTFRMNLLYGSCREVPEEELMRSVKDARLEELMNRLPEGFETLIGDRGVRLSGGEKQRLSIARAMLRNPEILFLDEATSSLDSKTERAIQQSLADLLKGKTSIVIAHRLSTIKNADQIIVLEHGRAAECGALDQLLALKGKFYEYWEEQKFF